ncbi:DNA-binding transcriptional regulator, AcrR family [Frankia sp. AiPs1]|uniref:TetR/AcrR family transcriptional regulator n=1 Tax=Frankia sp. AiPa1 TaxID=573492 RepID=UPI00202AF279|nr:TetR/AcrR family transcriptional regulator [Frankia sp. AiPa1]MCL9762945.1 TetR/AcrR family transcriptional regulator [Frankia sp. AiPa1]
MTVIPAPAPAPAPTAGRRRGDTLRRAIYDAVFDQLQTTGYAGLTMDRVAAAAQTSKAVLYRRWASKEEMVGEALRHTLPAPADVPLTGDLRADVLALLGCIQAAFTATRGTAFQLVSAEAGCDRPLVRQSIIDHVVEPCIALILDVLRRAADRGEISPDAANELVAASGPAMLVQYSLVREPIVPDEYVRSVVDQIVVRLALPPR